jgi:UDP-GlcNAc:undecaprenyl-phosphate GlcNAc-1-phosphate transferase
MAHVDVTAIAAAFGTALALGVLARRDRVPLDGRRGVEGGHRVAWLGGATVGAGLVAGLAVEGWPLPLVATAVICSAFALGLMSDVRRVPPAWRWAGGAGLGLVLAAGGLAADALPGTVMAWAGAAALFAVAVSGVDTIDSTEGLAGAAGALTALGVALIAARAGLDGPMVLALVTAAALAGFLVHNLPPASLVLGHNGAHLVGAALAVAVLAEGATVARLVGAITCLGVFLVDLLLLGVRRAVGGDGLDRGDLAALLRRRGLSHGWTLSACWMVHVAFIAVGVRAAESATAVAVATVSSAWVVALAWLVWFALARRTEAPR